MEGTRRVAAIDGAGQVVVIEEEIPQPEPGQLQIEVKASLVSPGTELGGVKGRREKPTDAPPRPFGYTNSGVVVDVGKGCDDIPVGTRVACMGGGYAMHATHGCVPRNMAVPIPDSVSFDDAAAIHLVATGLNAIRRAEPEVGEFLAVTGLGLVGQFASQWGRISGCHVMGLDHFALRIEAARECGIARTVNPGEEDPVAIAKEFSRGYGMDAAVIAFGGEATEAFKTLVSMMKVTPDGHQMGRIVVVGGARIDHGWASALGNLDVRSAARTGPGYHDEAWEHGADYPAVFVQWHTRRNLEECLQFIASGDLGVDPLITHRVSLDEAPEACERLIQEPGAALGVVIHP